MEWICQKNQKSTSSIPMRLECLPQKRDFIISMSEVERYKNKIVRRKFVETAVAWMDWCCLYPSSVIVGWCLACVSTVKRIYCFFIAIKLISCSTFNRSLHIESCVRKCFIKVYLRWRILWHIAEITAFTSKALLWWLQPTKVKGEKNVIKVKYACLSIWLRFSQHSLFPLCATQKKKWH